MKHKFKEGDLIRLKDSYRDKTKDITYAKVLNVIVNKPDKNGIYNLDNDYYNILYKTDGGTPFQDWMDKGYIDNCFELDIKESRKEKLDAIEGR